MRPRGEQQYRAPAVLASYSTEQLISDAIGCTMAPSGAFSDEALKDDVRPIGRALRGLKDLP